MKKKLPILIVIVLAVLGLGLYKFLVRSSFEYAGTVEATRIDLPSRVATVIKEVLVEEGNTVTQGQTLVRLACEDISLAQKLAGDNFHRAENLKKSGSLSKEAFDLSQNRFEEASIRWSWCEIKSPVNGTILAKYLEPSEWVNPGTKIVSVANLNELWAYFYVPQEVMSSLRLNQEVLARVPELNQAFKGRIVRINDEAEFTPKNVQTQAERTRLVFGIKIQFENPEQKLKPGMTLITTLSTPPTASPSAAANGGH